MSEGVLVGRPRSETQRPPSTVGLAWRLARRELRGGLKGFRVFLLCLLLGVAAIAAVGSLSQAMLGGLSENGRALLGGDVELRTIHQPLTAEQLDWMADNSARLSRVADLRAMARTESPDGGRRLVELKAVDSAYPLHGAVAVDPPVEGALPLTQEGERWGALVDPALLSRLDLSVGDSLRIGELAYEVRGTVTREPDRAARAFTLGPRVLVHVDSLGASGLEQPGSLIYYHYRADLPEGETAESWRSRLDAAYPDAGWRVRDISRAAPGVDRFIFQVTLFMTLVGLTALLVGGVGIANAVHAFLDSKRSTIATLKCLGAPGRLIFTTYLAQVLALALLGIGAGLALGALAPLVAGPILAERLNFQLQGGLHWPALALAAVFGLLTTLVFTLWPLARAQSIPAGSLFRDVVDRAASRPPRWALVALGLSGLALAAVAVLGTDGGRVSFGFVVGAVGALLLFRLAAAGIAWAARQLPRPRRPGLRLALTNLYRPGASTGSVVTSLGLGLTVLVAIALIEGNLRHQVVEQMPEEAPGFYFIDIQPDQVERFDALVQAHPGFESMERVPMLRGRITRVNGLRLDEMEVDSDVSWVFRGDRGVTWSAEPPAGSRITAGEWWPEDYSGPPLISLEARIAEQIGIGPGDSLTVNLLGRDIEAEIANLRPVDWSELSINFVMVFSPGLVQQAPQTHIATVSLDPEEEEALEAAVADAFPNVSAVRVKEALESLAQMLRAIATAVTLTASVTVAAGLLVLAGAVAAGQRRRVYDAVVLKVLGARRRDVLRAFLLEFGLMGVIASLLAVIMGTLAAWAVLTTVMRVENFTFLVTPVALTALVAVAVTLIFGFGGTWRALAQKAAPILRND
ncbi:ABC transporter permease [Aquibaculum arenosum]|uniref:ABC transporter permease n=1 Tax=Aquibaculum arenosum TaxID=3032591 RepID=A0ABT5YK12_9PROT|nr:FtsX-like permease family protein [Fodinicurvata sp. CAU 1616]MDF2095243.1 ABC transporter permease [Fodinicurvata sp. CAU 1616]